MQTSLRLARPSLPSVAAIVAASLGLLAGVGGVGLILASVSTGQPPLQIVTACVLLIAGVVNVAASRSIRHRRERSILLSAVVTAGLISFSAGVLHDFGEFFWIHAAYLLLLGALYRQRRNPAVTAA
jgi:peptidoglycan/LPS O-acetylase OafA/YrhL